MKPTTILILLVFSSTLSAATSRTVRVTLELTDGSRIVGAPQLTELPVRASFGSIVVPLEKVNRLQFDERSDVTILLRNGDRVTGTLELQAVAMGTLIGNVSVALRHIRLAHVTAMPGGPTPSGLVLWNTLGSATEIENSVVGPPGARSGGEFLDGKFGGAFVVRHDEPLRVKFPAEGVKTEAGCFEFWAKLMDFPDRIEWGANPSLVQIIAGEQHYGLCLNGNDGNSRGGLCGQAGKIGGTGTARFGQWRYAQVLGEGAVGDWHHYALVWDKKGIPGAGNGSHRVAIFLDGERHASEDGNDDAATEPIREGRVELFFTHRLQQGRVAYDNLKLWNYAKTDFSDRQAE